MLCLYRDHLHVHAFIRCIMGTTHIFAVLAFSVGLEQLLIDLEEGLTPAEVRHNVMGGLVLPADEEGGGQGLGAVQFARPTVVRRIRRHQVRQESRSTTLHA